MKSQWLRRAEAATLAATYIQVQSLLHLLPHLARKAGTRERLLSVVARVTRGTVAHFFSDLRAEADHAQ
jgi:hypothetical protein